MESNMRFVPVFFLVIACGGGGDEDDCWYCTDGATKGGATGTTGTKGSTKDTKDTTTESKPSETVTGEVDLATGLGALWIDADDCGSEVQILDVTELVDCGPCTEAWAVDAGSDLGTTPCDGAKFWTDLTVNLGHADPASLYIDKGGWFEDEEGTSNIDGDTWTFEFGDY